MRLLEEMTEVAEHYTDRQKKCMLEAAVRGTDNLRDVKSIEEIRVAGGEPKLNYKEYFTLLQSSATQCDNRNTGRQSRTRQVHFHDTSAADDNFSYLDSGDTYFQDDHDYDYGLQMYQAQRDRCPQNPQRQQRQQQ